MVDGSLKDSTQWTGQWSFLYLVCCPYYFSVVKGFHRFTQSYFYYIPLKQKFSCYRDFQKSNSKGLKSLYQFPLHALHCVQCKNTRNLRARRNFNILSDKMPHLIWENRDKSWVLAGIHWREEWMRSFPRYPWERTQARTLVCPAA